MTTIVQSPPTFTSLPRLGWDGPASNGQGGFSAMSNDDVSRMFIPQRKVVTRSTSSSSLASNASTSSTSSASSTSSTSTVTSADDPTHLVNGDGQAPVKKKQRGGFWPVSKAESTASVTNARAHGAVQPTTSNPQNALAQKSMQPAVPEHASNSVNGVPARSQSTALLVLLPMNGTFERKQINVPISPDPPQKIGRQTNNKTTPKQDNGYFDSKVLSRQHAEIWADTNGRIWIRDVKSSNGTFVNGSRLSPENRESEPTELRQHDSLELGIDIVSEDQKTIVHHKVSAKVEFAGFPGKAGNPLDLLSFGELDPTQSNSLLASPISAPMAHSRSQQGRPQAGRASIASSGAGTNMSSAAQRPSTYWGTPLNIETLVKSLNVDIRAARQHQQDLDQANSFLHALLPSDGGPPRLPQQRENQQSKSSTGRVKPPRIDPSARFADPPAPPPQQPLPEKPDSIKSLPSPSTYNNMLKRDHTAKPTLNGMIPSPAGVQSSQILSLLQSLDEAKKQIESQGSKVKELEEMLWQERHAREAAEDKIKRLEESSSARPISKVEEEPQIKAEAEAESESESESKSGSEPESKQLPTHNTDHFESQLQQRLDVMLSEMQMMQQNLEHATQRADTAESEKTSLAAMIEKYRNEREDPTNQDTSHDEDDVEDITSSPSVLAMSDETSKDARHVNGHIKTPKMPDHLQHAITALQQQQANGEVPAQYAPYMSMMGVVLLGVGIMAYLNSWQKVDK